MKLEWAQAPVKTQWGHEMVEATVEIDKDHTLSLYCEASQTLKVDALINKPWVGLTYQEQARLFTDWDEDKGWGPFVEAIEAKLKEKNT